MHFIVAGRTHPLLRATTLRAKAMTEPVSVYREMLVKELSVFRAVTERDEILVWLNNYWTELTKESPSAELLAEERAARLIWVGVGFLILGQLDHLEDTLRTMVRFPQSANYSACRYYVSGIQRLLPLPSGLSPSADPAAVLDWFQSNRYKLLWAEQLGRFVSHESGGQSGLQHLSVVASIPIPNWATRSAFVAAVRAVMHYWPNAVFGSDSPSRRYDSYWKTPLDLLDRVNVYRDSNAAEMKNVEGAVPNASNNSVVVVTAANGLISISINRSIDGQMQLIIMAIFSAL